MLKKFLVVTVLFAYFGASSVLAHTFAMDKTNDDSSEGCSSMQHMQSLGMSHEVPSDDDCYNDCFGSYDEFSFAKITENTIGSFVTTSFPNIDVFVSGNRNSFVVGFSSRELFALGPPYDDFFKNTIKIE